MKRFSQLKPTSWGDTPIIQRPPRPAIAGVHRTSCGGLRQSGGGG
ncbi:hypothetical protein [Kibdelosporangium philippinense]